MKRVYLALIGLSCAVVGLGKANALTIEEQGTGPGEVLLIKITGVGKFFVGAGILDLNIDGSMVNGLCIDPFHFSSGVMTGYHSVELTSAPKGRFMSADTALDIERLWGSYYSPNMSDADAAGLQIAIWELTGGSDFKLCQAQDFGAATFLAAVQDPNYSGPVADLVGLTGPGQDYAVLRSSIPDTGSTAASLGLTLCGLVALSYKAPRLAVIRA